MALPVILINSATGSDTAASGAGPATALTGAAGVTAADGLSVILDGSPDLSGVATDGSHVLFMSDTAAGARNFGKITGTANSGTPTATVTVADAFGLVNTDAWAIGGKRASIGGTTSKKLFDNNGGSGDWMPGWIVRMQSGHTETISARLDLRRGGDTTNGLLVLEGEEGAATIPVITMSGATADIVPRGAYQALRWFNIAGTGGADTCILSTVATPVVLQGLYISGFSGGICIDCSGVNGTRIISCKLSGNTTGISVGQSAFVLNCEVYGQSGIGISGLSANYSGLTIRGNRVSGCGGDGIKVIQSRTDIFGSCRIDHNTVAGCTGDGIEYVGAFDSLAYVTVINNIVSSNGAYGIHFSDNTAGAMAARSPVVRENQTYANTSGAYKDSSAGYAYNACPWASGDNNLDPTFTNSGAGDYSIGTNLKAKGFPVGGTEHVGGVTGTTYSYVDPGASQRQEAGGGGLIYPRSLNGGLV